MRCVRTLEGFCENYKFLRFFKVLQLKHSLIFQLSYCCISALIVRWLSEAKSFLSSGQNLSVRFMVQT